MHCSMFQNTHILMPSIDQEGDFQDIEEETFVRNLVNSNIGHTEKTLVSSLLKNLESNGDPI